MFRFARQLSAGLLVANLGIAALWFTVLHPNSSTSVGRAASMTGGSSLPIAVPPLWIPGTVQYTPQRPGAPIKAADGRPVAELAHVPASLSQSVGVHFGSLGPLPTGAEDRVPFFQVLSVVRYEGDGHAVLVTTAHASAAAVQKGLGLGNESFQLPDGSVAWITEGAPTSPPNQLRWFRGGVIVTVAGDLPVEDLKSLAAGVTVH